MKKITISLIIAVVLLSTGFCLVENSNPVEKLRDVPCLSQSENDLDQIQIQEKGSEFVKSGEEKLEDNKQKIPQQKNKRKEHKEKLGDNVKKVDNNKNLANKKIINVPYINQNDIISGCEAVSATMYLQYFGEKISAREFTDNFLIKKDWHIENGRILAADPSSAYPGNPYVAHGINCGFGCYAPVIVKSINKYLNNKSKKAVELTNTSLQDLVRNYIDKDQPVLIWATMDMKPSKKGSSWIIDYVDENSKNKVGDSFTWIAGEHCLVLVGYDQYNYYFNDPYKNHGLISYNKNLVEARFKELGCQSVAIINK